MNHKLDLKSFLVGILVTVFVLTAFSVQAQEIRWTESTLFVKCYDPCTCSCPDDRPVQTVPPPARGEPMPLPTVEYDIP